MDGSLAARLRAADAAVSLFGGEARAKGPHPVSDGRGYPCGSRSWGTLAEARGEPWMNQKAGERYRNPVVVLACANPNTVRPIDVLEALVYLASTSKDARAIAENAIEKFGSLGGVLSASVFELTSGLGVEHETACALKAMHTGMCAALREPLKERTVIGSYSALVDYLALSMKHCNVEVLHILYLDRKNALIIDERAHQGTIDHVPLYPREVVKRALEHGASAVILVHNHPSGDPSPSRSDIIMGKEVQNALQTLGILLHDHIIVGKNRTVSMRTAGHL